MANDISAALRPPDGAPRMGFGLAAIGRPAYINLGHDNDLPDTSLGGVRAHAHAMLDTAWARGIRWFDVARSYGRAEQFLGEWLADRGHGDLRIGTKWGYTYVGDWQVDADVHEVKTHDLATLDRQWPAVLEALGRRPDMLLIHSATPDTGVLSNAAVLARLAELAADGLRVGLSTSGPAQADTVRAALEVEVDGTPLFSVVQATWNLLEPSIGPALAEAAEAGWTVVVKEGVANGRLTPHGVTGAGDVPEVLAAIAAVHDVGPDAIALAAALGQPWAPVVLSGAATVAHLDANLRAVEVALTDDERTALASLAEHPDAYWTTRSRLTWT